MSDIYILLTVPILLATHPKEYLFLSKKMAKNSKKYLIKAQRSRCKRIKFYLVVYVFHYEIKLYLVKELFPLQQSNSESFSEQIIILYPWT